MGGGGGARAGRVFAEIREGGAKYFFSGPNFAPSKGRKGKDEKEDKTWKREKPPHQVWGFFWVIFYCKKGENLEI